MDQPFSSKEIIKMSRGRICPVGRASDWYKEFENAKKQGIAVSADGVTATA